MNGMPPVPGSQPNLLVIISDEHRPDAMGCAGHPFVRTPNLDALANRGTRFTNAYCASPMCVPTRAALSTGRHVHRDRFWDSATPYDGSVKSWMHNLRDAGIATTSIGKLHFRHGEDDNGFGEEILPMHVVGGVGWAIGLLRDNPPEYDVAAELALQSGRGSSSYTDYDLAITDAAESWLQAPERSEAPWAAFVSLVSPHFPLTAPAAFYDLYADRCFDLTPQSVPDHPEIKAIDAFFDHDRHFTSEHRHAALAAYFGLTSFLDNCIGRIMASLRASGQADNTIILYLSDHGEMLGDKGLWTKQVMYEASAKIPMVLSGPGVPENLLCNTAVSHVDLAATAHDCMGLPPAPDGDGTSLMRIAQAPDDPDRTVLSEYHDGGSSTGAFMVRWQDWKYVHYVGMRPQLFDLQADPDENHDLGTSSAANAVAARSEGLKRLQSICDPEAVNGQCFADQAARIETLGGRKACQEAYLFNHTPTPVEQARMAARDDRAV